MANIVQIQYIISAFIGFGSAVIVAIIASRKKHFLCLIPFLLKSKPAIFCYMDT